MTAQELRIGNYLQYYIGEDGCEWDNTKIDSQDIMWAESKQDHFNSVYKPIRLTPELLEKCGFENLKQFGSSDYGIEIGFSFYSCYFLKSRCTFGVKGDNAIHYFAWKIDYLHQLQNLFFAMTGTELTVNF